MVWQDIVLSAIGCSFGFLLLPLVRQSWRGMRLSRISTSMTGTGLITMGAVCLTLDLWLTAGANIITGLIWVVLFGLTFRQRPLSLDGVPGQRSVEYPCDAYLPGEPCGDCYGDGHYLCCGCINHDPEL